MKQKSIGKGGGAVGVVVQVQVQNKTPGKDIIPKIKRHRRGNAHVKYGDVKTGEAAVIRRLLL